MRQELIAPGALAELPQVLASLAARRVFLVAGEQAYQTSGAKPTVEAALAGCDVIRFTEFSHNPRLEDAVRGAEDLRRARADVVLAVGGGSSLDMAKLVNVLAHQHAEATAVVRGEVELQPGLPLIAIPTTAGTGSEATHFAVAYIGEKKYSLAHPSMLPAVAIVDAELSASMPPAVTASTAFDALSQAIESYWAVGATTASRAHARAAIELAVAHMETAVIAPTPAARDGMARAANLAGKAIDVSRTTAAHALSYPFTVRWDVAHGHAVALTLGGFFELNADTARFACNDPRGADHVAQSVAELAAMLGQQTAAGARAFLYAQMRKFGMETRLRNIVGSRDDLRDVVEQVNVERLGNNPVRVTPSAMLELLHSLY